MQPLATVITTIDELVEFEEDAAAFAQGEPEFVNGAAPAASGESAPTPIDPSRPHPLSDQEPKA
jgi:hypothetical protein